MKKSKQSLRDLWDIRSAPRHPLWESQKEKSNRKVEREYLKKWWLMTSFPTLMKDMNINMQEVHDLRYNELKGTHTKTHIIIKLSKDK